MRQTLKSVALTLASCGALATPALAQPLESVHDEVRARVCAEIRDPEAAADEVRERLREDPMFGRLLEHFRKSSLRGAPSVPGAEDAAQETLLKIWKGRPSVFLRPHAEVLRYLKSATRKNLWTDQRRSKAAAGPEDLAPATSSPDATDSTAAQDVLETLRENLDREDREVLESRLRGAGSDREVAGELGRTRYSVVRSGEQIERALAALI